MLAIQTLVRTMLSATAWTRTSTAPVEKATRERPARGSRRTAKPPHVKVTGDNCRDETLWNCYARKKSKGFKPFFLFLISSQWSTAALLLWRPTTRQECGTFHRTCAALEGVASASRQGTSPASAIRVSAASIVMRVSKNTWFEIFNIC